MVYDFKGPTASTDFAKHAGALYIYGHLKNGKVKLQQVEKEQKKIKNDLNEVISGNPKHKSKKQSNTIENIRTLYNSRQKILDLLNDNAKIRSEAIYRSKQNKTE